MKTIMKIKTEKITLHSFSIPNYILPTFQKTTMKIIKVNCFRKIRYVHFQYFEKEGDTLEQLKRTYIKIK
jgi:hypothetical protein